MSTIKDIFKAIQETFNNKYIQALYITIFIFIGIISIAIFPIILLMIVPVIIFIAFYLVVLYELL